MKPVPGRLVLLGHPVEHSLSPAFQNAALARAGIPLVYEVLDVAPDDLKAALHVLRRERAAGNVTLPHKRAVAAACTQRTAVAERTSAVNTFWHEGDRLVGDNTDVSGFAELARLTLGSAPAGARVGVLGAGGGAAAVLEVVSGWPGVSVQVSSRSAERAEALVARAGGQVAYDARAMVTWASVVVNATPVGLSGDQLPFDVAWLASDAAVMDLAYRRGSTALVRAARERGLRATDGLPMLIAQGAAAFERWFGVVPDRDTMWRAVGAG